MSTVLLDTTVASLLHPKKKQDALRKQYESQTHDRDHVGLNHPDLHVISYIP